MRHSALSILELIGFTAIFNGRRGSDSVQENG